MNRQLLRGATTALAMYGILSCSDANAPDGVTTDDLSIDASRIIGSISVSLASSSIQVGDTTRATAAVLDRQGRPLARLVNWRASDSTVATVSSTGLVTGVAAGSTDIIAYRNGHSGSATVTVTTVGTVTPVASITVALAAASIAIGQSTQATPIARDSAGNVLSGRLTNWSSTDSLVAIVSDSGKVTGLKSGSANIVGTSEGKSGSASLTVTDAPAPSQPSPVTDLKLVSVDSTTASLSFTQVDDGTGQPATYDVRYAPSPISWGSATSTASGTCTTPVAGTAIGATLTCSVARLSPSTKYDFQVIAFRGTLNQNAVFSSLSNIVTATTSASSTPPPPPPTGGGNEPAGMSILTDRPFNALVEDNWAAAWDEGGGGGPGNFSIVTDATAPKSPSNVGQMRYPVGLQGGYPPAVIGTGLNGSPTTVYISIWFKLSSNWIPNPGAAGAKIYFVWINGGNRIYTYLSNPSAPFQPWVNLQQIGGSYNAQAQGGQGSGNTVNLPPNVAGQTGVTIQRDRWYRWEVVFYGGTPGQANGTVDWWIDGTKVGHYTGIPFAPSGGTSNWEQVEWNPTWGGLGSSISTVQYMWMDHFYVSGKP